MHGTPVHPVPLSARRTSVSSASASAPQCLRCPLRQRRRRCRRRTFGPTSACGWCRPAYGCLRGSASRRRHARRSAGDPSCRRDCRSCSRLAPTPVGEAPRRPAAQDVALAKAVTADGLSGYAITADGDARWRGGAQRARRGARRGARGQDLRNITRNGLRNTARRARPQVRARRNRHSEASSASICVISAACDVAMLRASSTAGRCSPSAISPSLASMAPRWWAIMPCR